MVDLEQKLSRAQDLAIDGLISAGDFREKVVAIRAERERVMHEVEGSVDANFLPTDMGAASGVYLRMAEEAEEKTFDQMTPNGKRRQAEFDCAVWVATSISTEISTTSPSR